MKNKPPVGFQEYNVRRPQFATVLMPLATSFFMMFTYYYFGEEEGMPPSLS